MSIVTNDEGGSGIGETAKRLAAGAKALDAIEAGVRLVESDPDVVTVGYGGLANILGRVQLYGLAMDGDTLRSGAVGAIQGFAPPSTIARAVMDDLPHAPLVVARAERFAAELGAERVDDLIA